GEAAVAAAKASKAAIDQSLILQRDAIDQARATLDSAKAERVRAALDRTRYAELARDAWAPRQRLESAAADARKADASVAAAKAALASAQQQIEVLSAQRKEAGAKLGQAKATLDQAQVDLDKTVVRAPIDGAILKVNVRLGEYAQAGVLSDPLMTMGSVDPLHVRVDIDETEPWRIRPGPSALARLRGNPEIVAPLSFVRFEPYGLPKRSLTGDTTERVDTRVLQAIYEFAPSEFPAFVGQQVDVFIAAPSRAAATRSPTSGQIAFRPVSDTRMQIAGGASSTPLSPGADQNPSFVLWRIRRAFIGSGCTFLHWYSSWHRRHCDARPCDRDIGRKRLQGRLRGGFDHWAWVAGRGLQSGPLLCQLGNARMVEANRDHPDASGLSARRHRLDDAKS